MKTTTKTKAELPAEEIKLPLEPVQEGTKTQVELAPEATQGPKRLTLLGWIWTNHKDYKAGEGGKKSRMYFSMKYRTREGADIITEVHAFGAQADYLNENLIHNTLVVARGRFEEKARKDDPTKMESFFILNDAYGLTLPIPKKRQPIQE